jgi:hypothetical protein
METNNSVNRFVGAYYLSTAPNRIITIEKKDNGLIAGINSNPGLGLWELI